MIDTARNYSTIDLKGSGAAQSSSHMAKSMLDDQLATGAGSQTDLRKSKLFRITNNLEQHQLFSSRISITSEKVIISPSNQALR